MHLVQLLVPVYDNTGNPFPVDLFAQLRQELTDQFGGLTAYARAPARGAWQGDDGRLHHDDVVVVEVMVEELDRSWWAAYRLELARRFRQQAFVIRCIPLELL